MGTFTLSIALETLPNLAPLNIHFKKEAKVTKHHVPTAGVTS